jgi:hypothetical protein
MDRDRPHAPARPANLRDQRPARVEARGVGEPPLAVLDDPPR